MALNSFPIPTKVATKADVGLPNVDNTSDASKPISAATQAALNGKQPTLTSGNLKTVNGQSLLGSGDVAVSGGGSGATAFDGLSDKASVDLPNVNTPLKNALSAKADASALSGKQATLVSGTNVKTVNGASILGSGNLTVAGGSANVQTGALAASTTDAPNATAVINAIGAVTAGSSAPVTTAFATAIPLDLVQGHEMGAVSITSDTTFTVAAGAVTNGSCNVTARGDGTHVINAAAFQAGNSFTFDKTLNKINEISFLYRNGVPYIFGFVGGLYVPPDVTAPAWVSATVSDGAATIVPVLFDEDLDKSKDVTTFASAFTVSGHTVSSSAWGTGNRTVQLTVSAAFVNGEAARTLAFTQSGSIALQDAAGNKVASFSGKAITNNVAPSIVNGLAASTLVDNFNDGVIDVSKWRTDTLGGTATQSSVSVTETGGALVVTTADNIEGVNYGGITSKASFDLTGSGFYTKLNMNGSAAGSTHGSMSFQVFKDSSNLVLFQIGNSAGHLITNATNGGAPTLSGDVTYDPVNHAWLRIREDAGSIKLDAAPDNSGVPGTWSLIDSVFATAMSGMPLTAVYVSLGGGSWGADSSMTGKFEAINTGV